MYDFDYVRPATLAEASQLLKSDDAATCLSGGQTLLPTLKQRLAKPSKLVDLTGIAELHGITLDAKTVRIGATTTHAGIAADPRIRTNIPALSRLAGLIGDPQVRHQGTIGGSLANNDPAADWPAAVLGLAATIHTNRRQIFADDYFQGLFQTALEPGEIITSVAFPIPDKAGYAKFEQRASRFALVGVFVSKSQANVRIAVTGAGDAGVFRSPALESRLAKEFAVRALDGATVDTKDLLSDIHASATYRAALIPVMAERAVEAAG